MDDKFVIDELTLREIEYVREKLGKRTDWVACSHRLTMRLGHGRRRRKFIALLWMMPAATTHGWVVDVHVLMIQVKHGKCKATPVTR